MRLPQATLADPTRWLLVPILLAALAGCGGDDVDDAARRDAEAVDPVSELPAPEDAVGSVTGMPEHPGPGTVPLAPTGTGPAAPTPTGTGTGTVTGPTQGDAVVAMDDGGLDHMAVDTDFPEPAPTEQDPSSTASAHVPPIIIISEPRETPMPPTDTPLGTADTQDGDPD